MLVIRHHSCDVATPADGITMVPAKINPQNHCYSLVRRLFHSAVAQMTRMMIWRIVATSGAQDWFCADTPKLSGNCV